MTVSDDAVEQGVPAAELTFTSGARMASTKEIRANLGSQPSNSDRCPQVNQI